MEMEEPVSPMKVPTVSDSEQDDELPNKELGTYQKKRFLEIMHKHNLSGIAFCGDDYLKDFKEGAIAPALLHYNDEPWFDKISE
jgi:hypothetical protein